MKQATAGASRYESKKLSIDGGVYSDERITHT